MEEMSTDQRLHLLEIERQLRNRATHHPADDDANSDDGPAHDRPAQYALLPAPTVAQGARRTRNP